MTPPNERDWPNDYKYISVDSFEKNYTSQFDMIYYINTLLNNAGSSEYINGDTTIIKWG